jgi:uncharacterized protein
VEILPYARVTRLYREHEDEDLGLAACISFAVIQERRLTETLTTDDHFRQAGFRAPLIES